MGAVADIGGWPETGESPGGRRVQMRIHEQDEMSADEIQRMFDLQLKIRQAFNATGLVPDLCGQRLFQLFQQDWADGVVAATGVPVPEKQNAGYFSLRMGH